MRWNDDPRRVAVVEGQVGAVHAQCEQRIGIQDLVAGKRRVAVRAGAF
jgi:hypothetical protein